MTIKILVTQKHINEGCKNDGSNCPIALALLDTCKLNYVYVDGGVLRGSLVGVYPGGPTVGAWTPKEARQFICDFDNGRPVEPFMFEAEFREDND